VKIFKVEIHTEQDLKPEAVRDILWENLYASNISVKED